MNIFVLHDDPAKAAQMQCDKHVVKMILETAQLLCSVFEPGTAPYRRTHYNHPSAKWARESWCNYMWLIVHGLELCNEYTHRYGKTHKSESVILWCQANITRDMVPVKEMTPFPKCMPDEYKVDNVVQSYRNYYKGSKKDFAKWTNRAIPDWWTV